MLIAFIVAHLTASGRTEIRIAGNLVADAVAEAADDGAIFAAIFNQLDPNPDQRWPLNGQERELAIGNSRVLVQLEDEAGRINPSTASPALLEALLRTTGSDPEARAALRRQLASGSGPRRPPGRRMRSSPIITRPGSITGHRGSRSKPSMNSAVCSA